MKQLLTKSVILITFNLLLITFAFSQPGALDLSFNPSLSSYDVVRAIALQPDGKILVNECYVNAINTSISRIKRLHANGSTDSTFTLNHATDYVIRDIKLQPDGKVLFAGDFNIYDSIPAGRIGRLNSDGYLDTTFNSGTGFNNRVNKLLLQPDGKIVAGGLFTEYNGTACNHLIRLHSNGAIDSTFHTTYGANGAIEDLKIQPDGKIVIAGDFTAYEGANTLRVARVNPDGTRDNSWITPAGASAVVHALELQPDGKTLTGGNFSHYNLQAKNKLVRLHPNGDIDAQFYIDAGANSAVRALKLLNGGEVLIAGNFTTFKGVATNRLVKVSADCTVNTADFVTGTGTDDEIYCLEIQDDGKILLGGFFSSYNNFPVHKLARLYNCLTPQPDSIYGKSYALCSGAPQIYSVTPVSGATTYEWTLPNGWIGNSDSASIIATGNGIGGTITVKAFTDSCGWSYVTTRTIATIQPDAVPLCLVTVDTQSTHNIVLWEKPQTALIDSFFIYRETTSNVYSKIASLPYSALSEYHDTAANPNTTSYRYKLSVLDTCGAESDLSLYHSTIHLQNLGNGNFQWTFYNIESTANPVTSFNVYRDAFGNGNWFAIGNVPGTNSTFTDVTANSFPDALYVVDVNWGISCDPSRAVNTTRSNIKHKGIIDVPLAIGNKWQEAVQVFPNPAKDRVRVMLPNGITVEAIKLINSYGQLVKETRNSGNEEIELSGIPAGVYGLWIETNTGRLVRKVVIEW
ncbi:MAG: T9SS type A sorting domain-containing protein [Chitinophagales bacterium]|nr:T9SS type A sorting domain-containing protein [Chitinophagales bacterium]